jgi:asparagine synthase (glutamine-hydrolysing)
MAGLDPGALPAPWVADVDTAHLDQRALDLVGETEGSPIVSARVDTRLVLFDGVLYNREALLADVGEARPDANDADLVLKAYERWNADFLSHLKGLFALVVIDPVDHVCVAARDPLGAYPLYYARAGDRVVLSTSIDAIRRRPGVDGTVNRAALAEHLCHRWLNIDDTFFAAVRRLPAGCFVRAAGGSLSVSRYWNPVPDDRPVEWLRDDELNDRFDAAFEEAVRDAFGSGSAGIFLSGGLDSISVAAMATDLADRRRCSRPLALSLGFPGDSSEEFEQRSVASALGLEQEFVPFEEATRGTPLLTAGLAITREQPSPLLNTWMPVYTDLALRGKRRGVTTILSGAGGDEWLTVTPSLAADLMRTGDLRGLLRLTTAWRRSYRMSVPGVLKCLWWTFGARPLASSVLATLAPDAWRAQQVRRNVAGTFPWVAPEARLRDELRQRITKWLPSAVPARGFYLEDVRRSLEHPLTSIELEETFEMGRRLGIHFLHPYWDARIVDILYRTPPLLLLRGGLAKSLIRETMARRFPKLGLDRQKKRAGTAYFKAVLDREIPALWRANRDLSALADLGIVDVGAASAMADKSIASHFGTGLARTWNLVNVEAWVRAHH